MNKIVIYKIINPSGKIYIGQSTNIYNRFKTYKKLPNNVKKQVKLFNSLNKYSPDNHIFEVVEECDILLLNERERYWQDYYDVLSESGLNLKLTKCNDKSGKSSIEVNNKISKSLMGHSVSDKAKKISSLKNKGNKYCLGYKHTEEFLNTLRKPIIQYSIDGAYIREWSSTKDAAMAMESKSNKIKTKTSSISNCLNGITKMALGFKWEYKLI